MKSHSIIKVSFAALTILAASCSQDDALIDSQVDDNLQTYTLYLDADVPGFDTVYEGETRASGNSWVDGDVIYIAFSNGGNTVISNATYKNNLGAFQFSLTSLSSITDASCRVYYFREGSVSVSGNTVSMDKYTAIFTDTSAKYTCSNNVITMRAAFKPYTWRLCFKGTTGTQVKLKSASNIVYNTSLNLSSGSFSTKADSVNLLVQSDGYTPYVYGLFTGSTNTVKVKVGGTYYSRSLSSSKLAVGQSGYFTVPTTGNHANWSSSRDDSGFEYVDLGLPSGTLWAKCNLGASSEEEYGDFYAWGEISGYDGLDRTFDWSTYQWCSGSSSSLTKYNASDGLITLESSDDAATAQLGSGWRIPTREEWMELNNYTTKSNETINGIKGRRLQSTRNSNSIFLPFGGYFNEFRYVSAGTDASYWASTLSSTKSKAYIASTLNSEDIITSGTLDRCLTQAIRPVNVLSPNTINGHEYVDLGLPSGTLWATCNIGATRPEGFGGYYAWGETEEKSTYSWSNYIHCDGSYSNCHNIGNDIAGTQYDVAHVKWGGSWRIPTIDQLKELMDNCSVTWTTLNGVYGAHLVGPNGVSIFLPATGYLRSSLNEDSSVYIWSSSASSDREFNANYIHLSSSNYWSWGSFFRYSGLPVRAIVNPENEPKSNCPDENHPHLIDLGSAGKWACCNIGATKPEEYGGYYAWGETEEKDYYDWSTYTCSCYYDISSTEYDVAHVKWGGSWHMPSYSDFGYLMTNCSHEWTTQNGVEGVLVTSSNGNKIFLPAAGGRAGASLSGVGSWGKYWSSTPDEEYSQLSYDLSFYSNGSWGWSYDGGQYKGQSVRAVGR